MTHFCKYLWIGCTAMWLFAMSIDGIDTPPPDIYDLKPGWWQYFAEETTQQKMSEFEKTLQKAILDANEDDKNALDRLFKQVKANFQTLKRLPTSSIPPPKIALKHEKASVKRLIETHRLEKLLHLEEERLENELRFQLRQKKLTAEWLDTLRETYATLPSLNDERLLIAFERLAYRTANVIAKKRSVRYAKALQNVQTAIDVIQNEKETALQSLQSNIDESESFHQKKIERKAALTLAKKKLKELETKLAIDSLEEENAKTQNENELIRSKLANLELAQTHALVKQIRTNISWHLSATLLNPDDITLQNTLQNIRKWNSLLYQIQNETGELEEEIEETIKRSARTLSIEEPVSQERKKGLESLILQNNDNLILTQKIHAEIDDSLYINTVLQKIVTEKTSPIELYFQNTISWIKHLSEKGYKLSSRTLFYLNETPITLFSFLQFFFILLFAFLLSKSLRKGLQAIEQTGIQKSIIYRMARLFHYIILSVGVIIGLIWIGFDLTNLIILASALSVGIGFGLQSIFNNFISGIIILFQSHIRIGDFIELENELRGEIKEIRVNITIIRTNDGEDVLIPNSQMTSSRIINWTLRTPYRRIHIPFKAPHGIDPKRVEKAVIQAAKKLKSTLVKDDFRAPAVYFVRFGEGYFEFELVVWTDEKWSRHYKNSRSTYLFAIEEALKQASIPVPSPTYDVHLAKK